MQPTASRQRKRGIPKGKSKRRLPKRQRSSFASVLVVLLIPALLATLFVLYLRSQKTASQPSEVSSDKQESERPLLDEARRAGIRISRVRDNERAIEVESTDSLRRIEGIMKSALPDARVQRGGDKVTVTRSSERRSLIFRPFRTANSDAGLVEVEEGEGAWEAVATASVRGARIVMILDDVGYGNQPLEIAAGIPATLNFAVIPGAPRSRDSAKHVSRRGHEVLCHLPMEADSSRSAGSLAILSSMNDSQIGRVTRDSFRLVPEARGFNNHMGSLATADRRVMQQIFRALPAGMYFVDSRTTAKSVASDLARELDIPTTSRDVFLDNDPGEAAIRRQLVELVRVAEKKGLGVGIGHMYPSTVKVLAEEIPRLQRRGFRFVRASEAVN